MPRGVSEQLVEAASERLGGMQRLIVVDVGTGCGAIAMALARRLPHAQVLGLELDEGAVRWARSNGRRLRLTNVRFGSGSLLEPLPADLLGHVSLIVANVPCIPVDAFEENLDAPAAAYVGADADGLGLHRRLAAEARTALRPGGWLLVQLEPSQWPSFVATLSELGYDTVDGGDAEGLIARVGAGRWPGASGLRSTAA